jgi:hypothetical protein
VILAPHARGDQWHQVFGRYMIQFAAYLVAFVFCLALLVLAIDLLILLYRLDSKSLSILIVAIFLFASRRKTD